MNKTIYAVQDTGAEDINALMLFPNDAAAIRAFSEMLRSNDFMRNYASDFRLVRLGVLALTEGRHHIDGLSTATVVITAKQIIDSQEAAK